MPKKTPVSRVSLRVVAVAGTRARGYRADVRALYTAHPANARRGTKGDIIPKKSRFIARARILTEPEVPNRRVRKIV
jgi:hypothetical protein